MEQVTYLGLKHCYLLANDSVELIVATDIGPRILKYGFVDQPNMLGEYPDLSQMTEWGEWKPWGGHRMWIAPEHLPRSYEPDSQPVKFEIENEYAIRLTGDVERHTRMQKEMRVELAAHGSSVHISHTITNRSNESTELAVWSLTIMKPGGVAIVPHEPFHPFPEVLQPVRPMALWSYTRFDDPRFEFSQDFMRLRADPTREQSQKFGLGNKREWCAYQSGSELFVKRFPFDQNARYADFGCNNEIYSAGAFIEVESLSPLQTLLPGESARHEERWELIKVGTEETQLSAVLNRLNDNG